MAIPFLPIALGLAAAGSVLGGFQRASAMRAQKDQLKMQAQMATTEEANTSAERMRRLRQVLAANVASASGLGIDAGSASLLAVNEDAARQTGLGLDLDRAFSAAEQSTLRTRAGALSPNAAITAGLLRGGSRLLPMLARTAKRPPPPPNSSLNLAARTERLIGRV
jgi:hypothetical protein